MNVVLKGSTVSVSVGGQVLLGFAFNAALADGGVGLLARSGSASFDTVTLKTNDAAVAALGMATSGSTTMMALAADVVRSGPHQWRRYNECQAGRVHGRIDGRRSSPVLFLGQPDRLEPPLQRP
ncbi:hypothetical protein LP420_40395 [Massilia sp. B-10]|nr:hypothetical protein LP420_40395 [Massilia sp. B-10]